MLQTAAMPHRPQKVSSLFQFQSFWNLASIEIRGKIRSWRNLRHETILNPSQLRASRSTRGICVAGPESSLSMLWDLRPQTVILRLNGLRQKRFRVLVFCFYVLLNFCFFVILQRFPFSLSALFFQFVLICCISLL